MSLSDLDGEAAAAALGVHRYCRNVAHGAAMTSAIGARRPRAELSGAGVRARRHSSGFVEAGVSRSVSSAVGGSHVMELAGMFAVTVR